MARGFKSAMKFSEKRRTLGRQWSCLAIHSESRSPKAGRSKKKCSVSRNSGTSPFNRERGLMRSVGSSWLPQLSHWSPRASP